MRHPTQQQLAAIVAAENAGKPSNKIILAHVRKCETCKEKLSEIRIVVRRHQQSWLKKRWRDVPEEDR